ncbi:hypothetical protein GC175_21325 [bacterium]|nr:hypothetical protein [bacterium]
MSKHLRKQIWTLIGLLTLPWFITGCNSLLLLPTYIDGDVTVYGPAPEHPLYVLSVTPRDANRFTYDKLEVVDTDAWQVTQRTILPSGVPSTLNVDPQGRFWIGYRYNYPKFALGPAAEPVVIVSPQGEIERYLRLCGNPAYGIHFFDGYAFVVCSLPSTGGEVAVVDLNTLELVQTIELGGEDQWNGYISASSGTMLVLYGRDNSENSFVIDMASQTIAGDFAIEAANVRSIVSHEGVFYLTNTPDSLKNPDDTRTMFVLDITDPITITEKELPFLGPWRSVLYEDQLYTFHFLSPAEGSPSQLLMHTDLGTDETQWWPWPAEWYPNDMAWVNGKLIFANFGRMMGEDPAHGLYEFDFETGELWPVLDLFVEELLPGSP